MSNKQRNRKTKLVPRECVDSDDELKELQNEVEQTLSRIRGDKSNRNTSTSPINQTLIQHQTSNTNKPQFSIKVEVEECDEEVIDLSSSDSEHSPHQEQEAYNLTFRNILKASHELMKSNVNYADKFLHLEVLNYWKQPPVPNVKSNQEVLLEKALTRWREWFRLAEDLREPPLLYKCYMCNMAWWNLNEFREHIKKHPCNFRVTLEVVNCVESNIVAHNKSEKYFIDPGVKCWQCGELGSEHIKPRVCAGCSKHLFSCLKLSEHQWQCPAFKTMNIKLFMSAKKMYKCHLCPRYYFQDDALFEHMVTKHCVRSDVPAAWSLTFCRGCKEHVEEYSHACPQKARDEICTHCNKRYQTSSLLALHKLAMRRPKRCPICDKRVYRECMLGAHMLKHTSNYVLLYKCLWCTQKDVLFDPSKLIDHSMEIHETIKGYNIPHDFVIVPQAVLPHSEKSMQYNLNIGCSTPTVRTKSIDSLSKETTVQQNTEVIIEHVHANEMDTDVANILTQKCVESVTIKEEKVDDSNKMDCDDWIVDAQECVDAVNNLLGNNENIAIKEEICYDIDDIDCYAEEIVETQECIDAVNNLIGNIKTETDTDVSPIIGSVSGTKCEKDTNESNEQNSRVKNMSAKKTDETDNLNSEINEGNVTKDKQRHDKKIEKFKVAKDKEKPENQTVKEGVTKESNEDSRNVAIEIAARQSTSATKQNIPIEDDKIQIANPVANIEIKLSYQNKDLLIEKKPIVDDIQDVNLKLSDIRKIYHIDLNLSANPTNEINVKQEINEIDMEGHCENNWELLSDVLDNINKAGTEPDEECQNDVIILEREEEVVTVDSDEDNASVSTGSEGKGETESRGKPEKKKIYKCKKCSFYGIHRDFVVHKSIYCQNKTGRVERVDKNFQLHPCTTCGIDFGTFRSYLKHFDFHHLPSNSCPQCNFVCEDHTQLEGHVLTHIKSSFISYRSIKMTTSKFVCKVCMETTERSMFFKHWEKHLEPEAWGKTRVVVKKETDYDPGVRKIVEILTQPDKMSKLLAVQCRTCVVCHRRFNRRNDCMRHLIEHLLTDAFRNKYRYSTLRCQICGENFKKPEGFRCHLRFHASLPVYKCELCDKSFSDSSNFSKHKKVHNLRIVICDICQKKFNNKVCLIKHLKTHLYEPIKCKLCARPFFSESMYRKHYKNSHEKSRQNFRCRQCDTRYPSLKAKWDHEWKVHRERATKADCSICGAEFRRLRDVKNHMDRFHKNVEQAKVKEEMQTECDGMEIHVHGEQV